MTSSSELITDLQRIELIARVAAMLMTSDDRYRDAETAVDAAAGIVKWSIEFVQ